MSSSDEVISIYSTEIYMRRVPVMIRDNPVLTARISTSRSAAAVATELIGDRPQEHLLMILLDVKNQVMGVHTVHIGATASCFCSVKDVLRAALLGNADGIILCHNHPSGVPIPSPDDFAATEDVRKGCEAVGIRLVDHVIVTDSHAHWHSMTEHHQAGL